MNGRRECLAKDFPIRKYLAMAFRFAAWAAWWKQSDTTGETRATNAGLFQPGFACRSHAGGQYVSGSSFQVGWRIR